MSNCLVKLETSNINNVTSQERVKTETNFVKTIIDNPVSYSSAAQCLKTSSEVTIERKQISTKHKDKIRDNTVASQDDNNQLSSTASVAKISLVPTAHLLAQKPTKSHTDKFSPMDLTSGSLLITPVNDYQKTNKCVDEVKKDIVSITPYSESSSSINSDAIHTTNRSHMVSSSGSTLIPVSIKQRIMQESVDSKVTDKRLDDRDYDLHTMEMKEKKRDRWPDDKYKSHEFKKRRKEHKTIEHSQQQILTKSVDTPSSTILTRDEQEQRQIEETMAATNFLSQMINDDTARFPTSDKRKESSLMIDDSISNIVQPSEQEKDVQMVMRSLKELQELQEMKFSPSHSPLPKPKASHQYVQSVGYNDEYHRHYHKKDEKLRLTKDEAQW
ncbi:hypothetical protein PV327_004969 [Microctonus hyperodae]|uniref:Uncharacterized protein n=1 Tax=Microctonus hyperodae TaxID=165561 RepID=A0AA39KN93_MICHY|nr:hypothetical protein PV327_004969 [Microctonus hyperodae]